MTTKKLPVLALISWILLLGTKLLSLLMGSISLIGQISSAVRYQGPLLVNLVFNSISLVLLLCGIAAIVGVIVSLFRKKCGKLLIVSLILPIGCSLLSSVIDLVRVFLFNSQTTALSLIGGFASPLEIGAYLLLIVFTFGAMFPKNKVLNFAATKLFFLPCLLALGASGFTTVLNISNLLHIFNTYKQAGIPLTFPTVFSPLSDLLLNSTICLLFPIALLTLGMFVAKTTKQRAAELTQPETAQEEKTEDQEK